MTKPELSIVTPCLNEEASIPAFLAELDRLAERLPSFEVIFIDDGSTDQTAETVIQESRKRTYSIRLVRLSRNFGHQLALLAGMREASGAACVTIDVDLQDPPEVIVEMVKRWREGAFVAIGQRVDRTSDSWFKRTTAWAFYRVLAILTDVPFPQHAGDFRLVDQKVLKLMAGSQELAPYWRGLAVWVGFPRVLVPYERHAREAGKTKFTVARMVAFASDAIFSFSRKPLRISGYLGACVSIVSFLVISIHLIWLALWRHEFVPGWMSLMCLVGLIGGMQLICLGILGGYVGRIYELVLKRPSVIVQDSVQLNAGQEQRASPAVDRAA